MDYVGSNFMLQIICIKLDDVVMERFGQITVGSLSEKILYQTSEITLGYLIKTSVLCRGCQHA